MPRKRKTGTSNSLNYKTLEQRQLLAFDFLFDGSTLTLNQSVNDGVVTIDNSGATDEFRVNDGAGFVTYEAADNLVLNLLDNSSHLTLSINSAHNGDVTINAGDGARNILFASAGNSLDGNLSITAGVGSQSLSLAQISDLNVGGAISVDTGSGSDSLYFNHAISAGGDFELRGVNNVILDDAMTIGGDALVDNSSEVVQSIFEKTNMEPSSISGRFTYLGSNSVDNVSLRDFDIDGDVNVNHGRGITAGVDNQVFSIFQSEFNNLTFNSGDTSNLDLAALDQVVSNGDISIDMGAGPNGVDIIGVTHGANVSYSGLDGIDSVLYEMEADSAFLEFSFGDDNDFLSMNATGVAELEIDFGAGDDFYVNAQKAFNYDASLINLDGLDIAYEFAIDTISFKQRTDAPAASLELQSDPASEQWLFAGNGISSASNLNVSMADNNLGSFDFYLEHGLIGDLNIDLGHGDRSVDFLGAANQVGGDFTLTAGDGSQEVYLDSISGMTVFGNTSVDLGTTGDDLLQISNGTSFANGLNLTNINTVDLAGEIKINGNLNVDASNETAAIFFHVRNQITVEGGMNFLGSELARDRVFFEPVAASNIAGHLFVDLGTNESAIGTQYVALSPNLSLMSGLTLLASNDLTLDFIRTNGAAIAGDIFVSLGDGSNSGDFSHEVVSGEQLQFVSGSGVDIVELRTIGMPMQYNVVTGAGDDFLMLEATTNIGDMLRVDFGGGDDSFINLKGDYTWDTRLLNFHGFDNFYNPVTDSLRILQRSETSDVSVDNDNPSETFTVDLKDGSGYELTPAANLRVHMQRDSTSNLAIDLASPLDGNLDLNLGQTSRILSFVGTSNTVQGDLVIQAGQGDQNLRLSSQQDLTVDGNAMINLRQGEDSLVDNGNAWDVSGNLILRNVDNYVVTADLHVGGNMSMESLWFTQDVTFDNEGKTQVDGKFTYLGSDGADQIQFGGSTSIGDNVYIRLGDNVTPFKTQVVSMNGSFQAASRMSIVGGNSTAGNRVFTEDSTSIGGDLIVNFSGSSTNNRAILKGHYGGTYGTFRGGSAIDTLLLDAVAKDMFWTTLMHEGDDELSLDNSIDLDATFIDFGADDDLFIDNSIEDFSKTILNLP